MVNPELTKGWIPDYSLWYATVWCFTPFLIRGVLVGMAMTSQCPIPISICDSEDNWFLGESPEALGLCSQDFSESTIGPSYLKNLMIDINHCMVQSKSRVWAWLRLSIYHDWRSWCDFLLTVPLSAILSIWHKHLILFSRVLFSENLLSLVFNISKIQLLFRK